MKYVKQFCLILGITCVGELLHYFIHLPIPASIYGMVLLFLLLAFHVIPVEAVKDVGSFLIEIMPLMFIPAAVGLLVTWDVLRPILIPVLVITAATTVLIMAVTGIVAQKLLKYQIKEDMGNSHE
ncbi:MAG: CidA/LrgA family protein [Eubacterium sp.]|nr:CidA/LrgA family protein [Eubacterium sp.]